MNQRGSAAIVILIFITLLSIGYVVLRQPGTFSSQVSYRTRQPFVPETLGGTFSGTFPCADCPGITTVLTLNQASPATKSGTYTLKETYIDRNVAPLNSSGTWAIVFGMPGNKSVIVFQLKNKSSEETQYFLRVDDTHLQQLDSNMQKIDSPLNFTLTKTNE